MVPAIAWTLPNKMVWIFGKELGRMLRLGPAIALLLKEGSNEHTVTGIVLVQLHLVLSAVNLGN